MNDCTRLIALAGLLLATCSDEGNDGICNLLAPDCAEGLVCEAVQDAEAHCLKPFVVRGKVLDAQSGAAVEGALVQAVNANEQSLSPFAESAADGSFALIIPATRDAALKPAAQSFTLRSQAMGFQQFPTAIRPSLPLQASTAVEEEAAFVLESSQTTLKLLPLEGGSAGLGSIAGTVTGTDGRSALVVAEAGGVGLTGASGADGAYAIFNLPAGSYTVRAYLKGLQFGSQTATLAASENKTGVDLSPSQNPLCTLSGQVQIVNAPGGALTSVVLAVGSTFVASAARGQVPPGLRAGDVSGAFTIEGVPEGRYVVLAAFENDGLVRDPDESIGGTQIVHVTVPDPVSGTTITISDGFKVTGALPVIAPGADAPEAVTSDTPTFRFGDDSSEDGYLVQVFDSFGEKIWETSIGPGSGSATVDVTYSGTPSLEAGMYYQFRATSFRNKQGGAGTVSISSTEDLRGVFYR